MQKLEIKLIDRKVAKEKLTDGQSNILFSNQAHALEIKLIDRKVAKEKLTDGQSNNLFSNQAHALDGAIHGAVFP